MHAKASSDNSSRLNAPHSCHTTHDHFQNRRENNRRETGLRCFVCTARSVTDKRCVYILQSERQGDRFYTGVTGDLPARLTAHNAGRCLYTASCRPWKVILSITFAAEEQAIRFERYLKSGSGAAFARRHFR